MKTIIFSFLIGYILAWINHGKFLERIKNTHFYIKKMGYTPAAAWRRSGRTL